nr:hypothetical protein [Candidatus Freyarchaeota archaeon]
MPVLLFIPLIEVLGGSEIKKNDKIKDEDVKQDLISFFVNENHPIYRYGTPSECGPNSPYHRKQIEVLFEKKYFHWLTDRNVNFLINEAFLKEKTTKVANFVYRANIRYIDREINRRIKLIEKYSAPDIMRAVGEYAEMLSEYMFRINSFKILDTHTNEYNNKKWTRSNHDLDFIIQKDGITYGVEVKNTLPYMEREEFNIKLEICKYLNIIPLWILRYAPKPQFDEIKAQNGFILISSPKYTP